MTLKTLRQVLKGFGDDNRLRIISLLSYKELTVNEICAVIDMNQPAVSKHLVKLSLLKIVNDRREGNFIYYSPNNDPEITKLRRFFISRFKDIKEFAQDKNRLDAMQKEKG